MAIDAEPAFIEAPDGLKSLAPHHEAAWLGLLRAHSEVTHALDASLASRHGLSLGAYEVLVMLARAAAEPPRMGDIAAQSQLSLSRISRIIDSFEQRGLAARISCPSDSRVVHVTITDAGRALLTDAQETFFATIEERFISRLTCDEVGLLGTIFGRLVPPDARR